MKEQKEIKKVVENGKPLQMTEESTKIFRKAVDYHICCKPLGNDRVRNHDHITGEFRGAAHTNCNLQYRTLNVDNVMVPIAFHNLKNLESIKMIC